MEVTEEAEAFPELLMTETMSEAVIEPLLELEADAEGVGAAIATAAFFPIVVADTEAAAGLTPFPLRPRTEPSTEDERILS